MRGESRMPGFSTGILKPALTPLESAGRSNGRIVTTFAPTYAARHCQFTIDAARVLAAVDEIGVDGSERFQRYREFANRYAFHRRAFNFPGARSQFIDDRRSCLREREMDVATIRRRHAAVYESLVLQYGDCARQVRKLRAGMACQIRKRLMIFMTKRGKDSPRLQIDVVGLKAVAKTGGDNTSCTIEQISDRVIQIVIWTHHWQRLLARSWWLIVAGRGTAALRARNNRGFWHDDIRRET